MATEAALEGLYVGADHVIEYTDTDENMTGWTLVLDIRKSDRAATALLAETGVESGTYNATPASNTQKFSFTLSDDELAATIFTGDEWTGRYSIWRTDAGFEQPLRFGDCTITRTTRT
jgi:hypothetical protein